MVGLNLVHVSKSCRCCVVSRVVCLLVLWMIDDLFWNTYLGGHLAVRSLSTKPLERKIGQKECPITQQVSAILPHWPTYQSRLFSMHGKVFHSVNWRSNYFLTRDLCCTWLTTKSSLCQHMGSLNQPFRAVFSLGRTCHRSQRLIVQPIFCACWWHITLTNALSSLHFC